MHNFMKRAAAVAILTAAMIGGFFVGYRATILNAEVTFFNSQTVAVTVWGHTDLYAMEVYG